MVICSPQKFSLSRLDLPRGRVFGAGSPAFFHICTTGFILAGLHSAPIAPMENMTTQTSREEAKPAAALRVLFGSYALALGICSSRQFGRQRVARPGVGARRYHPA